MNLFRRLFGLLPEVREDSLAQEPVGDSGSASSDLQLQTRPLEPPRMLSGAGRPLRAGLASDVGQARISNQDAALVFLASAEMNGSLPPVSFLVVADGMGGHRDGELASALAAQTLARRVIEEIITPHLESREHSADQRTIPEVLSDSMHAANRVVQERVPEGGTTATCAVIRGDLAYIAHVGDSRAYLVSEGSMELITRDHSLVRRLQELGQLSSEEAESYPQRNVLYRAIGQGQNLEVDTTTRRLPPASRLLLCSDGLWGVIGDDHIRQILNECNDPQEACDRLVAAANAGGGPDNITAILIEMPD